jgi:hypothetical protein
MTNFIHAQKTLKGKETIGGFRSSRLLAYDYTPVGGIRLAESLSKSVLRIILSDDENKAGLA